MIWTRWWRGKISAPAGPRSTIVKPVASHSAVPVRVVTKDLSRVIVTLSFCFYYAVVPGAFFLGVKRPRREADHSPPSAEVKECVEL
jgi:hypothetical protein